MQELEAKLWVSRAFKDGNSLEEWHWDYMIHIGDAMEDNNWVGTYCPSTRKVENEYGTTVHISSEVREIIEGLVALMGLRSDVDKFVPYVASESVSPLL